MTRRKRDAVCRHSCRLRSRSTRDKKRKGSLRWEKESRGSRGKKRRKGRLKNLFL